MRHRHLDVPAGTPVQALGLAALDDLLDRGDLGDWQPVLAEIRADPEGVVAERIRALLDGRPPGATTALWRAWLEERPVGTATAERHLGRSLGALRRARGLTQQEVGDRLRITQPEVSRLERRPDLRVSVVRDYVAAVGGTLDLLARFGDDRVDLAEPVREPARPPAAGPRP